MVVAMIIPTLDAQSFSETVHRKSPVMGHRFWIWRFRESQMTREWPLREKRSECF
jgi:hypothetical protein